MAPDADEKTIQQAFRKLARQYHPDVNPGDKAAAEKFKEINEAYQVLSKPEERKKYDELRAQYQQWQQRGGRAQDFNWDAWRAQPGEGVRVEYGTIEDLEDLLGREPYSDFFGSIFGGMRDRGGKPRARRGRDLEYPIDVTLEEAYRGTTRLLQIGDRRVEARIPPGVRTGSRIRLAGQGEPGRNGGVPGDLYLVANVLSNSAFEREGEDLYVEVPVDIYTAALGGEARVPTLDGAVMLKIPPNTQAGRSFRLRGKGMPRLESEHARGFVRARSPCLAGAIDSARDQRLSRTRPGAGKSLRINISFQEEGYSNVDEYPEEMNQSDVKRCARWLEELDINPEGVEVILHMRQQMLELQARVRRLEDELGVHRQGYVRRLTDYRKTFYEASWRDAEE